MLALALTNADKLRVIGLVLFVVIAIGQWFRNSLRKHGRVPTIQRLVRIVICTFGGVLISVVPLLAVRSCPTDFKDWCFVPAMPGFLIAAITPFVGVHRDDNLLLYVATLLNTAIYGAILFAVYPVFSRPKISP